MGMFICCPEKEIEWIDTLYTSSSIFFKGSEEYGFCVVLPNFDVGMAERRI
jgi:hypothetical protein